MDLYCGIVDTMSGKAYSRMQESTGEIRTIQCVSACIYNHQDRGCLLFSFLKA